MAVIMGMIVSTAASIRGMDVMMAKGERPAARAEWHGGGCEEAGKT